MRTVERSTKPEAWDGMKCLGLIQLSHAYITRKQLVMTEKCSGLDRVYYRGKDPLLSWL